VLSHHTNLRACQRLGEMVQVLKNRHPQLKADVEVLRKGCEDCCNEFYLLGKMGVFSKDWDEDALVREMVRKRVHRLVKYLEEDLEDVEKEIREMEGECVRRILRPAGLELSLVFDANIG